MQRTVMKQTKRTISRLNRKDEKQKKSRIITTWSFNYVVKEILTILCQSTSVTDEMRRDAIILKCA